MSVAGERLPYPGLRSFTREETDIFFGREGCVDDMVDRLAETRFLAVLGASGSGKSSLVKTGLLDALEIGLLRQAGSRWLFADFRPGDRPISNLADGLLRATSDNSAEQPNEDEVKLLRTFLARGPRSVVEWCSSGNLPENTNLLLLVDQFEELFRYSAYAEREEAEAFVALLLESARAALGEARIYVAITMRSEYLGAAALIDGLAEAINQGLYLTPRMNRDQVREAIVGPAAVCGFTIEPALVNRLLNDLTSFAPWEDDTGHQLERLVRRADQLPLMQHVLNRLWSIAAARAHGGPVLLKLSDYDAVGGLRGALAAHGREILDALLPEHREVAASVFRALTAGLSLTEAVRRPTEFGELVEIAGGDEIAVREIVEAFRAPGRNFLVPPRPAALRSDTLIDISHESLIRQWDEFANWLHREITSADTWRRLVDATERYKRGEANLISGLTLASIANWWDTEHPTAAWAKRYGGDFNAASDFLAESRRTESAGKEREAEERRQKSRNRMVTLAAVLVLLVITPLTVFAAYSAVRANREAVAAEVAREEAIQQANAAEVQRKRAEDERARAEEQTALAKAETARADEERRIAFAARLEAMQQTQIAREQAAVAEVERQRAEAEAKRADEERTRALVAQQEAMQQAAIATAESERAKAESERADQERERAERARAEFQRANLQQLAGRLASLQQEGSWDTSSNLLATLWRDLIGPQKEGGQDWLIEPIVNAFARQSLAEFSIFPDFLNYSGFTGWTGTSGRFRVYALDRKAEDGETASGNKILATFDAMTGAVLGSYELPAGEDLGSRPDLVSPDGTRTAIVTDKDNIALWAVGQVAPTLIPVPSLGGEVAVDQLAPVHSDQRFALYLTVDEKPNELIVVDPATQGVSFTVTTADITQKTGVESIDDVKLLGFVDNRLVLLINKAGGQVVSVNATDGAISTVETGAGVTGAVISPDGALLLTLTCPGNCTEQHLTGYDLRQNAPLWVERVPIGMALSEAAMDEATVDGARVYSALVEQEGLGIVFEIPKDRPDTLKKFDAASHARINSIAFDGAGGYRVVEAAGETTNGDELKAAGTLASYRLPLRRQKRSLYVAPNSIAVYQSGETVRVAGVSYADSGGELLVYRMRENGELEDDVSFRPVSVGESDCIAAVGFGGDGKSLLVRHIDGSLLYVAAVGRGAGVDWRKPDSEEPGEGGSPLSASTPATDCDLPEAAENDVTQRIVAVDAGGSKFALLDKAGTVWWVDVVDGADEAAMKFTREFAPIRRASAGMLWIAGDPARDRVAMASRTAVEIVPQGGTVTEDAREVRSGATGGDQSAAAEARVEAAAEAGQSPNRKQKLTRWSEPKAVAFDPEGGLVVAYNGGQVSGFRQDQKGNWAVAFDGTVFATRIEGLFASKDRVALVDDRDMAMALDAATGVLVGHARLPANPSATALGADGNMLSLEWDTDSVATVAFRDLPSASAIAETAQLVAMRSLLDKEADASLDSLMLDREMERTLAASAASASDCAADAQRRLLRLEDQLLGEAVTGAALVSRSECGGSANAVLDAAETLAHRGRGASVRELVEDDAFSRLLQAAASGDATASRLFGAALARIAMERGEVPTATVAEEAMRFGANLPGRMLREVAAGGAIEPALLEVVRRQAGSDPAAYQLLAHADERRIGDVEALADALFEFSVAEKLYRAAGREDEERFVGHRRAQLARLLPDARVLTVAAEVEAWSPPAIEMGSASPLADLPSEPAARRAFNMENANRLAERLPESPLLEALRTELERARIVDLRTTDPKAAADLLIDLGRKTGAASGWSPDLVGEYLGLADEIARGPDAASAFRLAAEAMKLIGAAFQTPIHADAAASGLYRRAADLVAATAPEVPRDVVTAAMGEIDLSLLNYEYSTLPGTDATEESEAGQSLLESTARMAEALAGNIDNPNAWRRLGGLSLFWQGVLVNDNDAEKAAPVFKASVDALRPAVEADPKNRELRFRFAEALRWVGLVEPSSEETVAVEREGLAEYQTLWNDRGALGRDLLYNVGVGYGFLLANLSQTLRDVELADLADGRTAEDHLPWLFETLALASQKDDVNATMIDIGATTADATFVNGWYRMSSYGWAIGFMSGLVNVESGAQQVTQCDLLAADPYDPLRRAPGVTEITVEEAEPACRSESEADTGNLRALYQLARTISTDSDRKAEYLPLARNAAQAGVSAAFSLVGSVLSDDGDDNSDQAYTAASQRTIIESFPVLYPYLAARARTDPERLALRWYATKAAKLGMIEAHVALFEISDASLDKLLHLELAARLAEEAGDTVRATELRSKAASMPARKVDQGRVEDAIAGWKPETLVELPADSDSS